MNTPMTPPPPSPGTPERPPGPPSGPPVPPKAPAQSSPPAIERAKRVEAIFIAALEIEGKAERARHVALACGEDDGLRVEVEELLRADDSQGFLSGPAMGVAQMEKAGDRIGRYKLLQEIGEGGFGTVWMAEQVEEISRRVALKIIKMGMDTREVIARRWR